MLAPRVRLFFLAVVVLTVAASPASAQWTQVWSDEFNGTGAASSANWTYDLGGGGFGNNELQCYTSGATNATQTSGWLNIQARNQAGCDARVYTSARLKTQGIRNFGAYGKLEGRMRGPMGQGHWPAFWMLGSNITTVPWPSCGEIDIMEHVNGAANALGTIHWNDQNNLYASYTAANSPVTFGNWNTYAIEWTSSYIRWVYNGVNVGEANIAGSINGTDEFHRSFFLIMNLAVGGNWPGAPNGTTPFPANFDIDYARWFTSGGGTPTPTPTSTPTATPTTAPSGTPAPTATATSGGGGGISTTVNYKISNLNSGKCVDAAGGSAANGTFVQQYTCNGSGAQLWRFTATDSGYYRVGMASSTAQVWDVNGGGTADGTKVHLWAYGGGTNQQWLPEAVAGGYRFKPRSVTTKCLDVPGSSTADAVQLQQWTCNGSGAQTFVLTQQ